jgi:hypothetical protein
MKEPTNEAIRVLQIAFHLSGWDLTRKQCIHIILVQDMLKARKAGIREALAVKNYIEKNKHLY